MATGVQKPIMCSQIAYDNTTTGGKTANVGGAQRFVLRSTTDCYVDFDQPISTTQSYLMSAANTADTIIELTGGTISTIYAQGKSGSGILYIVAMIN